MPRYNIITISHDDINEYYHKYVCLTIFIKKIVVVAKGVMTNLYLFSFIKYHNTESWNRAAES